MSYTKVCDRLEAPDGLSELMPHLGVVDRHREHLTGRTQCVGRLRDEDVIDKSLHGLPVGNGHHATGRIIEPHPKNLAGLVDSRR